MPFAKRSERSQNRQRRLTSGWFKTSKLADHPEKWARA